MGFFDKFKQGLKKTAQVLNTDIRDLFRELGDCEGDESLLTRCRPGVQYKYLVFCVVIVPGPANRFLCARVSVANCQKNKIFA